MQICCPVNGVSLQVACLVTVHDGAPRHSACHAFPLGVRDDCQYSSSSSSLLLLLLLLPRTVNAMLAYAACMAFETRRHGRPFLAKWTRLSQSTSCRGCRSICLALPCRWAAGAHGRRARKLVGGRAALTIRMMWCFGGFATSVCVCAGATSGNASKHIEWLQERSLARVFARIYSMYIHSM